jgi:hypothetical protein
MRIHTERFLLDPTAPDREAYEIRARGLQVATFVTGGVNGKSADDTAIGNLADASEYHPDELTLRKGGALPTYSNGAKEIAKASGGAYRRTKQRREAESACPECGKGEYTVTDNRDAPIPNPPITIHDDDGRGVITCNHCDAELDSLKQLLYATDYTPKRCGFCGSRDLSHFGATAERTDADQIDHSECNRCGREAR